jgi:hypothetical protein
VLHPLKSAIVLLMLALACCGGGQKASIQEARSGLAVSLTAVNAARDTMVTWSAAREAAIVQAATSKADGEAKLAAHRSRVDAAILLFTAAYTSIAAASSALALAAGEGKSPLEAVLLTAEAVKAVIAVRQAVAVLKGGGS